MSGVALSALIFGTLSALQEPAVVEIDHVFIHVDRATPAAERLQEAGFSVPPDTSVHIGQGTASRGIFFDNAYVELIWVTDATELRRADPRLAARLLDRDTRYAPYGLGLRERESTADLPFRTRSYWAEWMLPGTTIELAFTEPLEPDAFIVPDYMAWTTQTAGQPPFTALLPHSNGTNTLTGIELRGPPSDARSDVFEYLLTRDVMDWAPDEEILLELELDEGRDGTTVDLRPALPVLIRY